MPESARESTVLRREVLPPPSTSTGWGLIVIASTAMSFALAGSLLMLRASMEVARARRALPVVVDVPPAAPIATPVERAAPPPAPMESGVDACRGPVYHAASNGVTEAVFQVCPHAGHVTHVVDY